MSSTIVKVQTHWRVVDIVIAAVIAVAAGVVFWGWSAAYGAMSLAFAAFPPATAFLGGMWLFAGVLGGLIIRKPGAALFCEVLAAVVEALLGSHWGITVLVSGFIQGLGVEIVLAAFLYRKFSLPVALLAGLLSGLFGGFGETYIMAYFVEYTTAMKIFHIIAMGVSGVVLAGLLSWLATRGLARTGALSAMASRKAHLESAIRGA